MTYSSSVISLQAKQKCELEALVRSSKTTQKAARRAQALLELGGGAKKCECSRFLMAIRSNILMAWARYFGVHVERPRMKASCEADELGGFFQAVAVAIDFRRPAI